MLWVSILPQDLPSSPPIIPSVSSTTFSWQMADASLCAHKQEGGTYYAHAAATVVRAAVGRIIGRTPEHFDRMVGRIASCSQNRHFSSPTKKILRL